MDVLTVYGKKLVDENIMALAANAIKIPYWVIEDDEDLRKFMKLSEDFSKETGIVISHGNCRKCPEAIHPLHACSRWKVVDAYVECTFVKRYGPFHRDGNVARGRDSAQKQRRIDIVVVRNRYQGRKLKAIFYLAAFQVEGETRCEWWRPIAASIIRMNAGYAIAAALGPSHNRLQEAPIA